MPTLPQAAGSLPAFPFDNTYERELEGFYAPVSAEPAPAPQMLCFNTQLAEELGLDATALDSPLGAEIFGGNRLPQAASPLAQSYAGHQFGGFSPQLGDGRALLLGEIIDRQGRRRDVQLKGSGRTPFSRAGDGKAAVGPVLREYLIGEAMHALGVPTTRALAAVATGAPVHRETALPGAVLTRVASSHIRIGTFQFFGARKATDKVRQLADYTIARHFPELESVDDKYPAFFRAVVDKQAALVAQWMCVGFVHGVMNTDNVSIAGETIDYGPCAFMEAYDPATVFSSIDTYGRYAYGNQPAIASWNLARFAETLLELVRPDASEAAELLTASLQTFSDVYSGYWMQGMRSKLGLGTAESADVGLVESLLSHMLAQKADFTLVFRRLSDVIRGNPDPARTLFPDPSGFDQWVNQWQARLRHESAPWGERADSMDAINPIYIPRNHKVEEALAAASGGDIDPFKALLEAVSDPFVERPQWAAYAEAAPGSFGNYVTYCGT